MIAQAALLTLFVLAGNTALRPLVKAIERTPISGQSAEASYDIRLLAEPEADVTVAAREALLEQLDRLNYPVNDVKVSHSDEAAEIVASLTGLSIEPAELDALAATLGRMRGVRHASWNMRVSE